MELVLSLISVFKQIKLNDAYAPIKSVHCLWNAYGTTKLSQYANIGGLGL